MSLKPFLVWLVILLCAACGQPAPEPRVELQVSVRDDLGAALSTVAVALDGVQVASTDAQGNARALVLGSATGKVRVSVRCPAGYRSPAPRVVPLGAQARALTLKLECQPVQRKLAVVVRARGAAGLLVRADGEALGRIDGEGLLHALVMRAPETSLRLTIDTSEDPQLTPQHPQREVHVADRDDIVVFDQSFETVVVKPRPARVVHKPRERTQLPYAIGRSTRW